MRKRTWILGGAVLAGLAIGGVALAVAGSQSGAETTSAHPSGTPAHDVRLVVRAQPVAASADPVEQTYTGIVRARYETELGFRVSGKIVSRHVEVGQQVAVGTLLFRLDPTDYQLAVKAAEADLAATEAEVIQTTADEARARTLQLRSAVSVAELDRAQSLRDMAIGRRNRAREALTLARNQLSYTDLTADHAGIITAIPAEAGQVVGAGQVVARLARNGEPEAVVSLPENQAAAARTAGATVTLWSAPGEVYAATLRELSPVADPVTRTYLARFSIQKPGPQVLLGMTATVHLAPTTGAAGYVLPLTSLHRTGEQTAVWVVERDTGKLTLVPVVVRQYRQEEVVLASGLQPGQWVVTAGVQKLDSGLVVRVWEPN